MTPSRRQVIVGSAAAALAACGADPAAPGALTLWGPPAGPSIVLAYAQQQGLLPEGAKVSAWRSPDELRAGLASKTMQVSVVPLNTAANLYNRGQDLRLLNVMTRGLLYVVSSDDDIADIPSLAGKRLAVPYRKDAPEIVLQVLLAHHGLKPERDVVLRTTGSPIEAVQLLLTGQVDAAFAPEPAVSAAIGSARLVGRSLRRAIDVQRAWAEVGGEGATLPQAGLAVRGDYYDAHAAQLTRLNGVLARAAAATNANPSAAASAASGLFRMPSAVLEASIPYSNLTAVGAAVAREEILRYFRAIHALDPDILGGRLPDDGFFL